MEAEDATAIVFLLAKLRKAKEKKGKGKGSTGFIRYFKTDVKKDCSSLSTLTLEPR